jgi:L-fuculose-phosphate aldolase
MQDRQAAKQIVEICRLIYARGFVGGSDGNVSMRIGKNRILTTPTGMSKRIVKPSDLVVCDLEGRKISGKREPTSEIIMHCYAYQKRSDIRGVVHGHPPAATGFAVAGAALDKFILPEVIVFLGQVPLVKYTTPGTAEVCKPLARYIERFDAFLLENHGVVTIGADLLQAYSKMEIVEMFAQTMAVACQIGRAQELSPRQLKPLWALKKRLGLRAGEPLC